MKAGMCNCYREIYAAINIPAAIAEIISTYAHVVSDSNFKKMCESECIMFAMGQNKKFICLFNGEDTWDDDDDDVLKTGVQIMLDGKLWIKIFATIDGKFKICAIPDVVNVHAFLYQNFSSKTNKSRRRLNAIWKKLGFKSKMPDVFITLANNMLAIMDRFSSSIKCPWEPNPDSKK